MAKVPNITVNGKPLEEVEQEFDGDELGRARCEAMRRVHARNAKVWQEKQLVGSGRVLQRTPRNTKNPRQRIGGILIQ